MIYLTGFADEAADSIEKQVEATRELGWRNIESRNINGKNIHDISDIEFARVVSVLEKNEVSINCFGSAIANWGKQITDPFHSSLTELNRAIPRMLRLGCKMIRIMSFAVIKDASPEEQMEAVRFKRVNELVDRLLDVGITPVHENCMNYGGMGYTFTLRLLENVPKLRLVFDTGNPVFSDDLTKSPPYPKQSSWEFYSQVKDFIEYVHVKDGRINKLEDGTEETEFTFPGEGDGNVKDIVQDLVNNGYQGGFSMEPHLNVVVHDESQNTKDEMRYKNYIEYGKRFMDILKDCGVDVSKLVN